MIKLPKTRQELVDMYIECLEEGKIPWEKMWKTSIPENGITGIKYRGVNNLYLSYITEKLANKNQQLLIIFFNFYFSIFKYANADLLLGLFLTC